MLSVETAAALKDVWNVFAYGDSSLYEFGHLMEMAFGCAIAYAILIRTGKLQGDHLEDYCTVRHTQVTGAYELLASEKPSFISDMDFDFDRDRTRCLSHVTDFRTQITGLTSWLAFACIIVAVSCVLGQIVSAIWEPRLPNYLLIILVLLAFLPVPLGLWLTMIKVRRAEGEMDGVYEPFLVITSKIRFKVNEKSLNAIEKIKAEMKRKRRGPFLRTFFGERPSD